VYAIQDFFEIRNEVLYGSRGRLPSEAERALDVGLALLHLVASIPRPTYRVVGQVPIYQDERGQIPVDDATGVVIRTTSPDGLVTNEAVYPTRRSYQVGSRIAWDWDVTGKFSAAWYQNQNGEYIKAWDRSAEFVGEPLSERESERSTR
jgi:hypothetical protein